MAKARYRRNGQILLYGTHFITNRLQKSNSLGVVRRNRRHGDRQTALVLHYARRSRDAHQLYACRREVFWPHGGIESVDMRALLPYDIEVVFSFAER